VAGKRSTSISFNFFLLASCWSFSESILKKTKKEKEKEKEKAETHANFSKKLVGLRLHLGTVSGLDFVSFKIFFSQNQP
jgi:hypothetical protein